MPGQSPQRSQPGGRRNTRGDKKDKARITHRFSPASSLTRTSNNREQEQQSSEKQQGNGQQQHARPEAPSSYETFTIRFVPARTILSPTHHVSRWR